MSDEPPRIHAWPDIGWARDYAAQQQERGWRCVTVDTSLRWDKAGFLAACRRAWEFPSWFGMNWDALADSLSQLQIDPTTGMVVSWRGWGAMARMYPQDFAVACDVLSEFVQRQEQWDGTALVALVGPGPTVPAPAVH